MCRIFYYQTAFLTEMILTKNYVKRKIQSQTQEIQHHRPQTIIFNNFSKKINFLFMVAVKINLHRN
jgi:hypothetical protein